MKLNPKLLLDVMYPVGSYYETSNTSFNPNTAWGGTWVREDDGTALVSYKSSGAFNENIETIVGEETHQLTINEMPGHTHTLNYGAVSNKAGGVLPGLQSGGAWNDGIDLNTQMSSIGGNQAHNNVQPSKVVYRWHRTA